MNYFLSFLKKYYPFVLYQLTLVVPLLGSPDKVMTQWLYISLVNIFLIFKLNFSQNFINKIVKNPIFIIYSVYILWSFLTIFAAYNFSESIIVFVRIINVFIGFLILIYFLDGKSTYKFLIPLYLTFFTLQNLKIFYNVYSILDFTNIDISIANRLPGFTMNKNISAYLILINLPYLFYVSIFNKKVINKIISSFLMFVGFCLLIIYGTRSSIITFSIIFTLFFIYLIYCKKLMSSLYILFPMILSYFYINNSNQDYSIVNRLETINREDSSINKRLIYYNASFETMLEYPIFGIGLGNWKIYSIEKVKSSIKNYTAPYHVHNDFLQKGAEGGVIGFIIYFPKIF